MVIQAFNFEEFCKLFNQLGYFKEIKIDQYDLEEAVNVILDLKLQE